MESWVGAKKLVYNAPTFFEIYKEYM